MPHNLNSKTVLQMIRKAKEVYVGCNLTGSDVRYLQVTKAEAVKAVREEAETEGCEDFFIASEELGTVWLG